MKKSIIVGIIFVLLLSTASAAQGTMLKFAENEKFDATDLFLTVGMHIKSEMDNNDNSLWGPSTSIVESLPLYDVNDKITAYYVELSDGGYMIANANKNNPIIIEFGYKKLDLVSNANRSIGNSLYYFAPGVMLEKVDSKNYYMLNTNDSRTDKKLVSYDNLGKTAFAFSNFLAKENLSMEKKLELYREVYNNYNAIGRSDLDKKYGFLMEDKIPTDVLISEDDINDSTTIDVNKWGTTTEFNLPGVTNHCGSTSAFNMVYYYRYVMGEEIPGNPGDPPQTNPPNRERVFAEIHEKMGNGPVFPNSYRSRLKSYIDDKTNYSMTSFSFPESWATLKNSISNDYMLYIIVHPSLFEAHYINGIGYQEYASSKYVRILDNWKKIEDKFYIWAEHLYDIGHVVIQ